MPSPSDCVEVVPGRGWWCGAPADSREHRLKKSGLVREFGKPPLSVSVNDDDTVAFDARFLHDVADPDLVSGAHDRLCAQSSVVFGAEKTRAAWERVPSTYLVCAEDRSTDPDLQRTHAARATAIRELPAAHFPMLSRPEVVAARIEEIARHAGR